jgi:hypothetical protein
LLVAVVVLHQTALVAELVVAVEHLMEIHQQPQLMELVLVLVQTLLLIVEKAETV